MKKSHFANKFNDWLAGWLPEGFKFKQEPREEERDRYIFTEDQFDLFEEAYHKALDMYKEMETKELVSINIVLLEGRYEIIIRNF